MKITTNLSSIITQNNLTKSSRELSQVLEHLSTGFKINHASDNAANYSIATNYSSQLSSYGVAQDNIASGLDMVTTVQDTLTLMQKHTSRLQALVVQAQNGTYGSDSISALNSEASSIVAEINRLYNSAEYNGIRLFTEGTPSEESIMPDWARNLKQSLKPGAKGFISNPETKSQAYVDSLTHVSELSNFEANEEYQVSTLDDLKKLAELVNQNKDTTNVTFYMGADIDCGGEELTPIGNKSADTNYQFKGTFDGNGHVIKNYKVLNPMKRHQGLFGYTSSTATVKNVGVEDASVKGYEFSALLIGSSNGKIINCFAKGSVEARERVGGIAGNSANTIDYSYADVYIQGKNYAGGIVGNSSSKISNSFSMGTITGNNYMAGLAGCIDGTIERCYSTASAEGNEIVGGLVGRTADAVNESYATGDVIGNVFAGGLIGVVKKTQGSLTLDKMLYMGHVTGASKSGSLIGGIENTYNNGASYANIVLKNGYVKEQELEKVSGAYTTASGNALMPYDITDWLNSIAYLEEPDFAPDTITLQVGINSNASSAISFDRALSFDLSSIVDNGIESSESFDILQNFMNTLTERATYFGSISNRLDSALDSVNTSFNNITSSLSTIKDADIAELSSDYVRTQILQQAAATLLATANQSPSIALQLI